MIPAINREAWVTLSRSAANLNQLAVRLNADGRVEAEEVREALADFRRCLLGAKLEVEDDDEGQGR
jgi:hypothetical protein